MNLYDPVMGTFGQNSEILRVLLGQDLLQSSNLGSTLTSGSGYRNPPTIPLGFLSGLAGLTNSNPPDPSLGSGLGNLKPQYPGFLGQSQPSLQSAIDSRRPLHEPQKPVTINMGQGKPPSRPKKITENNLLALEQKLKRFKKTLDNPLRSRRVGSIVPKIENLSIGEAKQYAGTVVFYDMVGSTKMQLDWANQPEVPFYITSLFCTVAMIAIQYQGGFFEKNTGDGVMAYFGVGSNDLFWGAAQALKAAALTRYLVQEDLNPYLSERGFPTIRMKVGMECGHFLIGRIGLSEAFQLSGNNLVAQGVIPNIASKITECASDDEILIGANVYNRLAEPYKSRCVSTDKTVQLGQLYSIYGYPGPLFYD